LAADITIARNSNDLILGMTGYFNSDAAGAYKVEAIKFADGTVWDVDTVKAKVIVSSGADDTLIGYGTADTINGGAGNDFIYGRGGNDTLNGGTRISGYLPIFVQSSVTYTLFDNVESYRVRRFTRHLLSTTPPYHHKSVDIEYVTRQNRA